MKGEWVESANFVARLTPYEIIISNLPEDTHLIDIYEEFEKYGPIENVEIYRCILNLPAYAKVTYVENKSVPKAFQARHWKVWRNKLISIKVLFKIYK